MLEVNSWVLVQVVKTITKQIYMQTILHNHITAKLTKLAFSFLKKSAIRFYSCMKKPLTDTSHPSVMSWLSCCSCNPHTTCREPKKLWKPYETTCKCGSLPQTIGLPSYVWPMSPRETKRAHGENRRLDNRISNVITPGENFHLLGAKLQVIIVFQSHLGRLLVLNWQH